MPRSFSRSMESSNCSSISRVAIVPVLCRSRSERVVFPWSIWAMMLKFLICAQSIYTNDNRKQHNGEPPLRKEESENASFLRKLEWRKAVLATPRPRPERKAKRWRQKNLFQSFCRHFLPPQPTATSQIRSARIPLILGAKRFGAEFPFPYIFASPSFFYLSFFA